MDVLFNNLCQTFYFCCLFEWILGVKINSTAMDLEREVNACKLGTNFANLPS